ncbi:MAG: PQQ-binding-like beta-propeller repeat protein, partial [Phycisphaerales bacterium]
VAADTAYILTETSLSAVDRTSGATRWSVPCDCPHALILAGKILFAGGTNKIVAYGIAEGDILWNRDVRGSARALAAAGRRLFASTDAGNIHMFGRPRENSPNP